MSVIKTKNAKGRYQNEDAREKVISYITSPTKAIHGFIGYRGVDPADPAGSMERVAQQKGKNGGVKLRHFILSFGPREPVTPAIVANIGEEIADYFGREYQTVYAVHEDTNNLHIHIVINSVSYLDDGHSYRGTRETFSKFLSEIGHILRKYGLYPPRYVSADAPMDEYE